MNIIKSSLKEYFAPITDAVNWVKRLFYIVKHYDADKMYALDRVRDSNLEIREAVKLIKDRTNLHVDVDPRLYYPTQVIAIGRYNGNDYIQVFTIHEDDFKHTVDRLKDMEKYGNFQRIDAPMEFHGVFAQEFRSSDFKR